MALNLYPFCHRGREDCEPIHCIASEPEGLSEEDYDSLNYEPPSFVCSGKCSGQKYKQDQYRFCFKNEETDEMSDNDMQDLTSIIAVVSAVLNYDAVMKVNNGVVEIPAEQSDDRNKD